MEIFEIIKAIMEYGVTIVLSAIVIYVVIRVIKLKFDSYEIYSQKRDHDKALALRTEIDEQVYDLLNSFLSKHDGTRIQVIEFTNTVTSVAYLPFRYMSCTYEVISYGHRPKANFIDKLSTSLFSPFLSQLGKTPWLELDAESAMKLSGTVYDLFHQIDCKHMISVMLKSDKNKCIGHVSLFKETDVTVDDTHDLVTLGDELSVLLGVLDK